MNVHRAGLLLGLLLPLAVHAEDKRPGTSHDNLHCDIQAEPGDRVSKGADVTVQAGERVENVVAVDGNVFVKRGASVKNAVALHGNVTLEAGARVRESALAFGGKVNVDKDATVKGSVLALGDGIELRSDSGHEAKFKLQIDGQDIGQRLAEALLSEIKACRVTQAPADKKPVPGK